MWIPDKKNQARAECIESKHVMSAKNFGRHLTCWQGGRRKVCKKDATFNQIEGDMHNLQPAIGEVNGDRSNYRYSLFTKEFNQYRQFKSAMDFKAHVFQPRNENRGMIARAYLYMSDKYKINLSNQEKKLMMAWNTMYAPENFECKRNAHIAKVQDNDNKFVTGRCTQ
ncbi:endonuclease [Gilliamella sp. Pas-s25]|uniref:endonuclease n=1 Tax=Gilliamella sp. Pas-s25 TaxID=2687310 RepID=UPI00135E7379|nr:endonuclease [Gilliamella sp. Pas-s25]MWP62918.1 deoxyribonuclease I [Gilliamella sp. Pas-s25]